MATKIFVFGIIMGMFVGFVMGAAMVTINYKENYFCIYKIDLIKNNIAYYDDNYNIIIKEEYKKFYEGGK